MVVQTITVDGFNSEQIVIGRRGTYDTEQIEFDISYLIETYGEGTAVLMMKRSQDSSAYPATDVVQDENTLTWTVNETDTSYKGSASCEIFWTVAETSGLTKSVIFPVIVMKDIAETTQEAPSGWQNWVDTLTELGAETLQNAQDAEAAQTAAETAQGLAEDAQDAAESARDDAVDAKTNAETAEGNASAYALKSEGYAVGKQNGSDVSSDSPYYENNAEYMKDAAAQYALQSDSYAGESAAWATGSWSGNPSSPVPSTEPQYENNAYYYAGQAASSASDAYSAKTDAETAQGLAETAQGRAEYAQGKAEDAQEAAETAVTHYPQIVNDYWYVWDSTTSTFVNTGVRAKADISFSGSGIVINT